jgi:hypothetical protein
MSFFNGGYSVGSPYYLLLTSKSSVNFGEEFFITFKTNQTGNFSYTITGVNSEDIDGASLTGTFTSSGQTLTLKRTIDSSKTLAIELNNGQAQAVVFMPTAIYSLTSSKNSVNPGEEFTVIYTSNGIGLQPYTITGVTSADINGESLTGTFNGSSDTLTLTRTTDSNKTFNIALNNGLAQTSVAMSNASYILTTNKNSVKNGESFTVTYTSNGTSSQGYTITGVTSGDINGQPLTGTFTASGQTRTFTATNTAIKSFNIALNNGNASVGVSMDILTYFLTYFLNIELVDAGGAIYGNFTSPEYPHPLLFIEETTPPASGYYGTNITYTLQYGNPPTIVENTIGVWSGSISNFLRIGTVTVEQVD